MRSPGAGGGFCGLIFPGMESILRARNVAAGGQETIRQFVEDLFQYEYLLLRKRGIEFRVETPPKPEG